MDGFAIGNAVLVNLEFTLWTGRAKLDMADVPDAAQSLPSKELYNSGSIKIFDTDYLKQFRNFKTRAELIVSAVGCRLLNGWLVDVDNMMSLETALGDCHSDWSNALAAFIQEYPQCADEWAMSCGQWEQLVRNKQPAANELWRKFQFDWQTFRLTPETAYAANNGNSTDDLVNEIPDKALQSVIDSLTTLYNDSFNKQGEPSAKAYHALKKIAQRSSALGFANPNAARLAPVLLDIASQRNHTLARLVLSRMDNAQNVLDVLSINDGQGIDSLLCTPDQSDLSVGTDSMLELNDTPCQKSQAPLNSMDVLDSLGLF